MHCGFEKLFVREKIQICLAKRLEKSYHFLDMRSPPFGGRSVSKEKERCLKGVGSFSFLCKTIWESMPHVKTRTKKRVAVGDTNRYTLKQFADFIFALYRHQRGLYGVA
jgi:hypothetical protein